LGTGFFVRWSNTRETKKGGGLNNRFVLGGPWAFPRALLFLFLLMAAVPAGYIAGQEPLASSVQGRIWAEAGTPVEGVLVRAFPSGSQVAAGGAESDELGYYQIDGLPAGAYRVEASRLGFKVQSQEVKLRLGDEIDLDFVMVADILEVEGISVEAERSRERIRFEEEAGITVRELGAREIKSIPGLAEADPLRAIEVLPGVVTTSDFSSAFNVRGGSADQNLILLDGIPVFNPTHLGGFFSVFNGDMIDRAELQSGGFPARFGGRVSSVLVGET
jgi:hypothetical protein